MYHMNTSMPKVICLPFDALMISCPNSHTCFCLKGHSYYNRTTGSSSASRSVLWLSTFTFSLKNEKRVQPVLCRFLRAYNDVQYLVLKLEKPLKSSQSRDSGTETWVSSVVTNPAYLWNILYCCHISFYMPICLYASSIEQLNHKYSVNQTA